MLMLKWPKTTNYMRGCSAAVGQSGGRPDKSGRANVDRQAVIAGQLTLISRRSPNLKQTEPEAKMAKACSYVRQNEENWSHVRSKANACSYVRQNVEVDFPSHACHVLASVATVLFHALASVATVVLFMGWMTTHSQLRAQSSEPSPAAVQFEGPAQNPFQSDEVDAAIDRGLRFLLTQQRPEGAIADRQHDTTMSALAIMALASTGITPTGNDKRGLAYRRALEFVLKEDRQE
jgi:hypothetical protein